MTMTAEPTKTWAPPTWLALEHPNPIPCQRTACAEQPHDAREHLDPRHERYDGPSTTFQVLPGTVKDSARALWAATNGAPEVVDMAHEILRLRDQVAAVQVDADRKVREASARAHDCADHGKVIAGLEQQVHQASENARRKERARVALLPFPQMMRDTVTALRRRQRAGDAPTVTELLDGLDKAVKKVFAAHARAVK